MNQLDPDEGEITSLEDLTMDIIARVDELLAELQTRKRGLTCMEHGKKRHDTRCPICALVSCRIRSGIKGRFL